MTEPQTYIPGMCNINQAEVAYRKKAMWSGVVVTVVFFVAMILLPITPWARLLLFVPLYITAIGYLQVKNKFCVAYGASGKQNATDGNDAAEAVIEKEALAADKAKTRKMNLQAFGISIVVLIILLLVPSIPVI